MATETNTAACTRIPSLMSATRAWESVGCPWDGPEAMMVRLVTRLVWAGWSGPETAQAD